MTGLWDKFDEWMTDDIKSDGHRAIRDDAPEEIKEEAKKADALFFERTGRHMFHFDD